MEMVDLKELTLKKVRINGSVIGKFGTFEIEQEYKNNTNKVLEVSYTFPIVETATVVGFEIDVEGKVLKGICKEKNEAKKEYAENMVKGNSAYLMEQETANVFKISIGKIDKNENVKIKINYIDKFEIIDNNIQILIPTLVTPKYKSEITDKLNYSKVDYTVDFNIEINKNLNRKSIHCISHEIKVIDEENLEKIEVLNYDLSKDFKLEIKLKNELLSSAITTKTSEKEDIIYMSFMPEVEDSYEDSEKEYMFIIDCSGSMRGIKMEDTKRAVIECLKQLDVGDKFNIIPFTNYYEHMEVESLEYNEENLKKAILYVENLNASGGTEILSPIQFALLNRDTDKVIMLFTDGQVGNEKEIINYVSENINKSRLFPFGIDTNVNSAFIKELAKVGHGKAELIQPKEKIDDKIIRTFSRIQTPLFEDITIDYGKNKLIDEIKEESVLFNYEFFNVFAKVENIVDDITLKGKVLNKEYSWKISKEQIKETNINLELLFAKEQMNKIENYIGKSYDIVKDEMYKKMIIDLAVKYNINSKYTSFITINEREDKILDVPEYQNITLSNRFEVPHDMVFRKRMSAPISMSYDVCCDMMIVEDYSDKCMAPTSNHMNYKKKVTKFFKNTQDNFIVKKIKNNEELNEFEIKDLERIFFEDLGSVKEYHDNFGDKNVVEVVRSIVGLDKECVNKIFEKYLNDIRLNEIQKQFVKKLMEYLIKNGVLDYAELCEETFFDLGESVADIFDGNIKIFREIQKDINEINKNGGKNL